MEHIFRKSLFAHILSQPLAAFLSDVSKETFSKDVFQDYEARNKELKVRLVDGWERNGENVTLTPIVDSGDRAFDNQFNS